MISIYDSRNMDLDNYSKLAVDVEITILPSIDYEEVYYNYKCSQTKEEMNVFLHQPIDVTMKCITDNIEIFYDNNYIARLM